MRDGDSSWTNITTSYESFVTGLTAADWKTFDLNLLLATTSSTGDPFAITITFKSVAK
ncbi:MAG: hypothetical protein NT038_07380 [Euryarchaeota archaeon]|nr:hypothetical protein [Euryarchaeota archaeon]